MSYPHPGQSDPAPDWHQRRSELQSGMIFDSAWGRVMLERRVPGDGTQWYVADWYGSHWSHEDSTIEPGDLEGEPLASPMDEPSSSLGLNP